MKEQFVEEEVKKNHRCNEVSVLMNTGHTEILRFTDQRGRTEQNNKIREWLRK